MKIESIQARDLPDAWFQCVYHIFEKGYEYTIDRGSFKGQKRIEYDYFVDHIAHPGQRPLIPDIPPGCNVPPPTSMEYVEQYLEKLITSRKDVHETYTYGEDRLKKCSFRWHAAHRCGPTSRKAGASDEHRGSACGQRGWK